MLIEKQTANKKNINQSCKKCDYGDKNSALFCLTCENLNLDLDVNNLNPASIFPTLSFLPDVNCNNLKKDFLTIAKKLHPDFYSAHEQSCCLEKITEIFSHVNSLYHKLIDETKRAEFVLSLFYAQQEEDENENITDIDFLDQIFDLNCEIKSVSNQNELHKLKNKISSLEKDVSSKLKQELQSYYPNSFKFSNKLSSKHLQRDERYYRVKSLCGKLKLIKKLHSEIAETYLKLSTSKKL